MKQLSRVVWSEGMYLGPHHFQVQSRYFEDSIRFSTSSLWFAPWGFIALKLDQEALQNDSVAIIHARGIFPDGLTFHMDGADPLPPPRPVGEHFQASRDGLIVSLAIPVRKQDGLNCLPPEAAAATPASGQNTVRFAAESEILHDETTGRDEKPVHLGRKNIRIVFDTERTENTVNLPFARIIRDGSGRFVYDPTYIPPVLDITASDRIMSLLGRLIEILEEKSAVFSKRTSSWVETASREVGAFWLTHTINAAMAPLRHIYYTRHGHPDIVYQEMLRLGGALCTFALDSHPRSMPLYDHAKLSECFSDLDYHIRSHLDIIIPTAYVPINLVKRAEYFYEAECTDQRVFNRSRWMLGIKSSAGEAETIMNVPKLVKICSKEFIPRLVQQALPGMALTHVPVPPSQIPAKVDFQYFSMTQAGPCWDHLSKTRKLGLYVPGELPAPELELLVILEQ
ncbi:MAG: type VI secretion system baseplate subunit TssK [Acidobacteria bacterium]|nr:type VI secretion system baseplate subunit TssK [Acidobacteriota bacterium]